MRSAPPENPSAPRSRALLLVGHGSHLSPDSSAPVHAHAARIRAAGLFDEVRVAFWKEEPSLRDALALVESEEIFVVPLFLAEGYFTDRVVPRELAAGDPGGRRVVLCPPVGTHERMAELIERRAVQACGLSREARRDAALVVIGHGTERSPTSGDTVLRLVERLRERAGFGTVTCGFLDQEPRIEAVVEALPRRPAVLVPFFVADGWHARTTIPRDLGLAGSRTERDGRRLWYTPPVGTLPEVAEVAAALALEAAEGSPAAAAAPPSPAARARAALLEWVDAGDGAGRTLLQAWMRRTGDGGYELRHEADRYVAPEALAPVAGPASLLDVARSAPSGAYRPLRAAPDLRRGWRLDGASGAGLWEALSALYPVDVVRWHQLREGALPVVPFAATAARQTGMYAGVGELRGEALDRAVGECCGARCLRTPVWAPAATRPAPGAETVPCPEACSLFVSFAREALDRPRDPDPQLSTTPRTAA